MTCPMCREAGRLNADGFFFSSAQLHKECEFPATCTCQHQTGAGHVNPEAK